MVMFTFTFAFRFGLVMVLLGAVVELLGAVFGNPVVSRIASSISFIGYIAFAIPLFILYIRISLILEKILPTNHSNPLSLKDIISAIRDKKVSKASSEDAEEKESSHKSKKDKSFTVQDPDEFWKNFNT